MRTKKLLVIALVASLSVGVSNAFALTITGFDAPSGAAVDTLGGLGGAALDVYTIVADSDSAAFIQAFDLVFTGTFAQAQDASFGSNVPSPRESDVAGFGPAVVAQDTHFIPPLILPGPPIPPPTEGTCAAGVPTSCLADNLLSNQVAIAGPSQAPVVAIAQIVVPQGTPGPFGTFAGTIAVQGNPTPIPVAGFLGIPEPSTMVLAGLSLMAVFSSRRRLR